MLLQQSFLTNYYCNYFHSFKAINPGNSGGPALYNNQVVGVNSMKINNAESCNMLIPSNRVQRWLPSMCSNGTNDQVQKIDNFAGITGLNKSLVQKLAATNSLPDPVAVHNMIVQHSPFGFQKNEHGMMIPVSFKEFANTHKDMTGFHNVFQTVVDNLMNEDHDTLNQVVTNPSEFACKHCTTAGTDNNEHCGKKIQTTNLVNAPSLGFDYSFSTPLTRTYFGVPANLQGIVCTNVHGETAEASGLIPLDYIHAITMGDNKYDIDDVGEHWLPEFQIGLQLPDLLQRCNVQEQVTFHVIRDSKHVVLSTMYDQIKNIPAMNNASQYSQHKETVVNFSGITLKALKQSDCAVLSQHNRNLVPLMDKSCSNEFHVLIADVSPISQTYHNFNLKKGQLVTHINNLPVATSMAGLVQQLAVPTVMLRTDCHTLDVVPGLTP